MYNDNYLTLDDEMELEDAGLDVDELAEMDWDERYDAIDEAGLNPLDYDYGFLDDDYSGNVSSVPKQTIVSSSSINTTADAHYTNRSRKLTRKEKREIRTAKRAYDDLETTLDALFALRL